MFEQKSYKKYVLLFFTFIFIICLQGNHLEQVKGSEDIDIKKNIGEKVEQIGKGNGYIRKLSLQKPPLRDKALKQKLDDVLADERLEGVSIGVSVQKAQDAEKIYNYHGNHHLHPASNMKLLTGAAALDVLGPDYQFPTELVTDGKLKGSVLQGDLFLISKGNPTLLKKDLDQFAKKLKEKGIQKINGNLIGDDSWYDNIRYSQDLNWSDEYNYTGAPVSALTLSPDEDYDTSSVIVEVFPGEKQDAPPTVKLTPETSIMKITNKAKTVEANTNHSITVERQHGENHLLIEGEIPLQAKQTKVWRSVEDPTIYTLDIFKQSLEEHGIQIIGKSKIQRGKAPKKTTLLTSKQSIPLKEIMIPFMKLSNNGIGEMLVKEMGQVAHGEGSWEKGLEVMEEKAVEFGMDEDHILLRDGSGMSHKNIVTADSLTQLLYEVQDETWFPIFENAQPIAGEPERMVGGSLRFRMTEEPVKGNVKAKTGSLTGVNTLSGYVTSRDGEKMIFSILFNNQIGSTLTDIQDEIVTILAEHEFK
ncbi:D-alanyl-D-alanine carboxypeptidase/D-alanyl-D-alanine-endopeptidase [Cerasibacillus terrae]|uniref:D-alanyl-D-alanine carboxypeptidase/D-alanyl-D-alanine-endopeptidase n=1 Tax=Cerasibacillus terrae TaxID=2498845 RepID=A0A5C8NQJ1_9BACI|nr:D-alanyl-D-alanine carboxypeptidase/D-alanyl-D-alanine-endopeptidase [Cerasibacillus terrae]TXL63360.1 D-alanyl-D-alanine carboxypeptidase/D-alanyl-D-alanine-endopeptidase [Cerasibacillus terrae]